MKIDIRQIPPEGLTVEQEVSAGALDLNTDIIKFCAPLHIMAQVLKITNAVTVEMTVESSMSVACSRCLGDFKKDFKKNIRLSYQADNTAPLIELGPDIRDELMLDYPIKPLCSADCKGLCPKCGCNLNEKKCNC